MDEPADAQIAALAGRQHGNVTRRQLHAVGLTDGDIAYRVKIGRLHRVYTGVYSVGRPPRTNLERAAAAVLACGPGAALSHASAMGLWGFSKQWGPPCHVTVGTARRRAGIQVHRSRTLVPSDVRLQLGIRVTSPARTALDCAPDLGDERLSRFINDALRTGHLKLHTLAETIARLPRHPGAARLRPFVEEPTNPTRSWLEDTFLPFCERFGLPRPEINTVVAGYEADAVFRAERLIVELDGWEFHGTRDAFERDRDRDANTLLAGWGTVRITKRRIEGDAQAEADRLHAILASRRRSAA